MKQVWGYKYFFLLSHFLSGSNRKANRKWMEMSHAKALKVMHENECSTKCGDSRGGSGR